MRVRGVKTAIGELGIVVWADENGNIRMSQNDGPPIVFPGTQYPAQLVVDAILTVNYSLSRDQAVSQIKEDNCPCSNKGGEN